MKIAKGKTSLICRLELKISRSDFFKFYEDEQGHAGGYLANIFP